MMDRQTTSDPDEATTFAFARARNARVHPIAEPYQPFNEVAYAWGTKRLYRGAEDAIRELVLGNLRRLSKGSGFRSFGIFMRDDSVVQVSAYFDGFFIGVQIWRAGEEHFTSGNKDFAPVDALADDHRIRMESTEKSEDEHRRRVEELQRTGIRLAHSLCGGNFAVEECEITRVKETVVLFFCPKCRVPAIHSLK